MDRFDQAERRRLLREKAVEYMGGECDICGYDKCPDAMAFHHIDLASKDFDISDRMTSWAAIEEELAKCVLVCVRCHSEIHAGYHPGYIQDFDDRYEQDV